MGLGRIAILVGSGIAGSVLIGKDGTPNLGDVLSGAAKFVKDHGKEGKDAPATGNSHVAQLASQVDRLREEIKFLSMRPTTIVTNAAKSGPGSVTITAVLVAGVIGYAYIKWKGWKLSDMMFVTKRGLSDACNVVGSQLDQVSDSVNIAQKHLAGRIDRVDISLDETQEVIEGTRDEVAVIHGDLTAFQEDLQSVNLVVQNLESKLESLECTQDHTANGIRELVEFTQQTGRGQNANIHEATSSIPKAIGSSSEQIVRRALLPAPLHLQTVSPVAQSTPMIKASQSNQSLLSQTSSTREASPEGSNGTLYSTEASSSRFSGLRQLSGLGILKSYAI